MTDSGNPKCFGILDVVFPLGDDGLRHPPDICMACESRTECLMTAMEEPAGLKVQEEMVDRAYAAKKMSFLSRWSRKKYLKKREMKKKQ